MATEDLVRHLCHKLFIANPDGKKLIELLKDLHVKTPVFPCDFDKLQRHGGAKGWATYRAGELGFILKVELFANEYENMITAQSTKKDQK